MIVTVTKFFNVSVGAPSLSAPSYQKLAPGSEVEVEEEVYQGDAFEGESRWLRDAADNYYWMGGTDYDPNTEHDTFDSDVVNYNKIIEGIPDEIRATQGEGTLVCVMDTGCYKHNAFGNRIVETYDVTNKKYNTYLDKDTLGHGTSVCGIIAAQNISDGKMIGVAPKANLLVIKITKKSSISKRDFRKGLEWLLTRTQLPRILNLSFDIPKIDGDEDTERIKDCLTELYEKGVLIIGAAQNNQALFDQIFFPASHENVLAIGALSLTNWQSISNPFNPDVDLIVPDMKYVSVTRFKNQYITERRGCSFSSALISGIAALFTSYYVNSQNHQIKSRLMLSAKSINSFSDNIIKFYRHENTIH